MKPTALNPAQQQINSIGRSASCLMRRNKDYQDKILKWWNPVKWQECILFCSYIHTENSTLENLVSNKRMAHFGLLHLYSMKQVIKVGFILDVLPNYTTYRSYYEIEKSVADNPLFDSVRTQKKTKAYVEKHGQTIGAKAEIMFDHFLNSGVKTKKLKGKAKAMVVCQSIESAIRYYQALNHELEKAGRPFKILIAFSGMITVDRTEYTEPQMNGFAESLTHEEFDEDECFMLVVANKYLTGFDQLKLTAMYVDERLQGVQVVQTLSWLNRPADRLGKRTEDLFVLEFFNNQEIIKYSFDPFYPSTSLKRAADINVLHELKENIEKVGVFEVVEVEEFNRMCLNNMDALFLSPIIDKAAVRFSIEQSLEDKGKADFKAKAKQLVKIYGKMVAILPFEMIDWEKLFWFLKFWIPKLVVIDPQADALDKLLESVDLSTYGIERTKLGKKINLNDSESELAPQNPNPRGVQGDSEKDELERSIETFNERWFTGWDATPEEQRIKVLSISQPIQNHSDYEVKMAQIQDLGKNACSPPQGERKNRHIHMHIING